MLSITPLRTDLGSTGRLPTDGTTPTSDHSRKSILRLAGRRLELITARQPLPAASQSDGNRSASVHLAPPDPGAGPPPASQARAPDWHCGTDRAPQLVIANEKRQAPRADGIALPLRCNSSISQAPVFPCSAPNLCTPEPWCWSCSRSGGPRPARRAQQDSGLVGAEYRGMRKAGAVSCDRRRSAPAG